MFEPSEDGNREDILDFSTGFSDESDEDNREDDNFQGTIRTVAGASLVYKRKTSSGTYEELWIYNVGGRDIQKEIHIRRSILAGTDIDPTTERSPDNEQYCRTTTLGNVQFLHIHGLIN